MSSFVIRPWVPISSRLTHMVYLLPLSSYIAGSKSVSARPSASPIRIRWQIPPLLKLPLHRAAKMSWSGTICAVVDQCGDDLVEAWKLIDKIYRPGSRQQFGGKTLGRVNYRPKLQQLNHGVYQREDYNIISSIYRPLYRLVAVGHALSKSFMQIFYHISSGLVPTVTRGSQSERVDN